jgi:hypothetical protein
MTSEHSIESWEVDFHLCGFCRDLLKFGDNLCHRMKFCCLCVVLLGRWSVVRWRDELSVIDFLVVVLDEVGDVIDVTACMKEAIEMNGVRVWVREDGEGPDGEKEDTQRAREVRKQKE